MDLFNLFLLPWPLCKPWDMVASFLICLRTGTLPAQCLLLSGFLFCRAPAPSQQRLLPGVALGGTELQTATVCHFFRPLVLFQPHVL